MPQNITQNALFLTVFYSLRLICRYQVGYLALTNIFLVNTAAYAIATLAYVLAGESVTLHCRGG